MSNKPKRKCVGRNGRQPIALLSLSQVAKVLRLSKGQVDRAEQSAFRKIRKALSA